MTDADPADDQGLLDRFLAIDGNLERVKTAYFLAAQQGCADPVVIVFDLTDPTAFTLAAKAGRPANNRRTIRDCAAKGLLPISSWCGAKAVAFALLNRVCPEVAADVQGFNMPGRFPIVAIGSGKFTLHSLPILDLD
jgi:hypothetical protein